MSTRSRALRGLLLLLTLVLLSTQQGCRAFSFDRDWKRFTSQNATQPSPATGGNLTGRWEGTWHSEGTGHSGRLRAIVEQPSESSAGGGAYNVRFDAIWGGVFRFGETVRLSTHPAPPTATQPARLTFDDTHDAGWLGGGLYNFTGEATDTQFSCRYRSKADHGRFELTRVAAPPGPRKE